MSLLVPHHGIIGASVKSGGGVDPDILLFDDFIAGHRVGFTDYVHGSVSQLHRDTSGSAPLDYGDEGMPYIGIKSSINDYLQYYTAGHAVEERLKSGDDFTWEFWSKSLFNSNDQASQNTRPFFDINPNTRNNIYGSIQFNYDTRYSWNLTDNDTPRGFLSPYSTYDINPASRGWTHWAFVRHTGICSLYKNGVYVGNFIDASSATSNYLLLIPNSTRAKTDDHQIAHICFTARARWTENFTPPTTPYVKG